MQARVAPKTAKWLVGGILVATLSTASASAWAQAGAPGNSSAQPAKPASTAPRPEDLEPGVNTSATSLSSAEPAPPTAPAPRPVTAKQSASAASGATGAPADSSDKISSVSRSRQKAPTAAAGVAVAAPKPGAGKAQDRLDLDTTQITGNRELPKVLYIVPWKRSDLGDLVGRPVNSLLDEVLAPVDRDVFKRENRYYDALKPDDAKKAAGAATGSGDKP